MQAHKTGRAAARDEAAVPGERVRPFTRASNERPPQETRDGAGKASNAVAKRLPSAVARKPPTTAPIASSEARQGQTGRNTRQRAMQTEPALPVTR